MKQLGFSSRKWTYNNPVLPERTFGIETDTNKIKIGDGVTNWNDLPYLAEGDVKEASNDGKQYARKDGAWVAIEKPDGVKVWVADSEWFIDYRNYQLCKEF